MSKEDLKQLIRGTSLTILKTEGRDDPIVHVYGNPSEVAVAAVIGQAMVNYYNRSEKARDAVVAICRGILEEATNCKTILVDPVCDDSDSEGGLISEE